MEEDRAYEENAAEENATEDSLPESMEPGAGMEDIPPEDDIADAEEVYDIPLSSTTAPPKAFLKSRGAALMAVAIVLLLIFAAIQGVFDLGDDDDGAGTPGTELEVTYQ